MDFNEIARRFEVRKLSFEYPVKSFNCGDADLNDFILNEATLYQKAMLAVSYVLWEKETKQTVAFFILANDKVSLSDFDNKTEFNRFRKKKFVNEKRLRSYPAVKICRLGVDESLKGMSIGSILLKFIKTFFVKDNKTGCRFITVDAYSNAISFYERNEFIPLNDDDKDERTRLLYFDLYDVRDE